MAAGGGSGHAALAAVHDDVRFAVPAGSADGTDVPDLCEGSRGGAPSTGPPSAPADRPRTINWPAGMPSPAVSQWNRIARAEAATDGHDLLDHARLFALLNVALADAETSAFDAIYTFRFWRPVTAIRNADRDGNPATTVDRVWSPALPTPPHPRVPLRSRRSASPPAHRVMTAVYGRFHRSRRLRGRSPA